MTSITVSPDHDMVTIDSQGGWQPAADATSPGLLSPEETSS